MRKFPTSRVALLDKKADYLKLNFTKLTKKKQFGFFIIDNLNFTVLIVAIFMQGRYLDPSLVGKFYISTVPSFLLLALISQSLSLTVLRDKGEMLKMPSFRQNLVFYLTFLLTLSVLLASSAIFTETSLNIIAFTCVVSHSFHELYSLVCEANQQRKRFYLRVPLIRLVTGLASLMFLWFFLESGLEIMALYYWLAITGLLKWAGYRFLNDEIEGKISLDLLVLNLKSHSIYSFLNFLSRNLDQYMFSLMLGPTYVGIYNRSLQITQLPLKIFNSLISGLFLPSALVNETELDLVNIKKNQNWIVLIACATTLMFKFFVVKVVILFWGAKWDMIAVSIDNLAPAIIIQAIIAYISAHAVVSNQDHFLPKVGTINLVAIFPVIVAAGMYGFVTATFTYSLSFIILAYPLFEFFVGRHILQQSLFETALRIASISIPIALTLADETIMRNSSLISSIGWISIISLSLFNIHKK